MLVAKVLTVEFLIFILNESHFKSKNFIINLCFCAILCLDNLTQRRIYVTIPLNLKVLNVYVSLNTIDSTAR